MQCIVPTYELEGLVQEYNQIYGPNIGLGYLKNTLYQIHDILTPEFNLYRHNLGFLPEYEGEQSHIPLPTDELIYETIKQSVHAYGLSLWMVYHRMGLLEGLCAEGDILFLRVLSDNRHIVVHVSHPVHQ